MGQPSGRRPVSRQKNSQAENKSHDIEHMRFEGAFFFSEGAVDKTEQKKKVVAALGSRAKRMARPVT